MNDEGALKLAYAIVAQAIEDLKKAYMGYWIDEKDPRFLMDDVISFLKSEDCKMYCEYEPEWMVLNAKLSAVQEAIDYYDYFLNTWRNRTISLSVYRAGKDGKQPKYKVPPVLMNRFEDAIKLEMEDLHRVKEELEKEYEDKYNGK